MGQSGSPPIPRTPVLGFLLPLQIAKGPGGHGGGGERGAAPDSVAVTSPVLPSGVLGGENQREKLLREPPLGRRAWLTTPRASFRMFVSSSVQSSSSRFSNLDSASKAAGDGAPQPGAGCRAPL